MADERTQLKINADADASADKAFVFAVAAGLTASRSSSLCTHQAIITYSLPIVIDGAKTE